MLFKVLLVAAVLVLSIFVIGCFAIASIKRRPIPKVGADLVRRSQVWKLYYHALEATRFIEHLIEQDSNLPIFSDDDRMKAERLVKAFYDNK